MFQELNNTGGVVLGLEVDKLALDGVPVGQDDIVGQVGVGGDGEAGYFGAVLSRRRLGVEGDEVVIQDVLLQLLKLRRCPNYYQALQTSGLRRKIRRRFAWLPAFAC